jgi:LuxR family transcriptional regulator of csgAB operon
MTQSDSFREPVTQPLGVFIVGRPSLQNTLLARLIDERLGVRCLVRPLNLIADLTMVDDALVLLDLEGRTADDAVVSLKALSMLGRCRSIALINADEDGPFERYVICPKLKGVFFRESSAENLLKGVRGIFDGECWLPRRMLTAYLERTRNRRQATATELGALTPKEVATLKLLAGGNSNSHIAQQLNVSPHTVKTHVYNVFRKINVSNRVQAAHWVLQNIDGVEINLQ